MKLLSAIILIMLSSISNAKGLVIVLDATGEPISGAQVIAMSYSITMKNVFTNAKGEAIIEDNIQGVKWLTIKKKGYEPSSIDVTEKWPLYVKLFQKK